MVWGAMSSREVVPLHEVKGIVNSVLYRDILSENLWDALGIRVETKKHSNKTASWKKLQEEWEKIPKNYVQRLVNSMPRLCAAVIAVKGMATKY